jgi:Glycosyl hydrolases family 35
MQKCLAEDFLAGCKESKEWLAQQTQISSKQRICKLSWDETCLIRPRYANEIGKIIAKAQITNGGPVIMLQPENEYSGAAPGYKFPDPDYMEAVYAQFRKAGIIVPLLSNDAWAGGHNAPGQPAPVDIYGHDGYPLGFDCSNPETWGPDSLPTNYRAIHLQQSPNTPFAIVEFQGGSYDPWQGPGFARCARLTGAPFERVFYKNVYAAGATIFNVYMTYGGTNWGNLGMLCI